MSLAKPIRDTQVEGNPPAHAGRAVERLVEFGDDGVEVDAVVIAKGFGVNPDQVLDQLRSGAITSRCEKGIGEDEGRYRLTFFSQSRRLQLIVDTTGAILQRSMINFGQNPLPATLRAAVE